MEKHNDNRWIINRAGLVNFWYYDEEIFDFADGRLLLRGANGSGKSVTMQSFIPLLLDGNKSPERLDPFGSKARKIENYLLGDDDNGKDESIGYVFMEFVKKHSQNVAAIGLGFRAKRGKALSSWGFCLKDGRQIGKDFFLYKQLGEKIPLTMRELQNRIGDGGQVVEGQKNYMKMVNELIFGFDDLEEYDELVKLLVQLRSPKLSKEFKPTVIYEIMENSLQPLSEDDLRPMSEAIENMDNIKSRLEVLKDSQAAAERIRHAFDRYNQLIFQEKAQRFVQAHARLEDGKKRQLEITAKREATLASITTLEERIRNLALELETQQQKKDELQAHDSVRIREKMLQLEAEQAELSKEQQEKQTQLEQNRQKERELAGQIGEDQQEREAASKKILAELQAMDELADICAFDEHAFMRDELRDDIEKPYSFSYHTGALKKHGQTIRAGLRALEKQKDQEDDYDRLLLELDALKKDRDEKKRLQDQASRQLGEIQEETLERLHLNNQTNQEYRIPAGELSGLASEIRRLGPDGDTHAISGRLKNIYDQLELLKKDRYFIEDSQRKQIEAQRQEKAAELENWQKQKEPEPVRTKAALRTREQLSAAGIPFLPLYKALDFAPDVDEKTRGAIETAMTEMGILDALIIPESCRKQLSAMTETGGEKFLFAEPRLMVHTLNQYLTVDEAGLKDSGLTQEAIVNVINSILIDEQHHTHLDDKGHYRLGILWGKAEADKTAKFIGVSARKRYREAVQQDLETELAAIVRQLAEKNRAVAQIKTELDHLKKEYETAFDPTDLQTAAAVLKQADFEMLMSEKMVAKKTTEETRLFEAVKKAKETVYRITQRLSLPLYLDCYQEAEAAVTAYGEALHGLVINTMQLGHLLEGLKTAQNRYDDCLARIDDLLYESTRLRNKAAVLALTCHNLSEQLALTDYEAIKSELEQCLAAIKAIPVAKEEAVKALEREKMEVEWLQDEAEQLKAELLKKTRIDQIMEAAFGEERELGYVLDKTEQPLIGTATAYLEKRPAPERLNREQSGLNLMKSFNENAPFLRDYSLASQTIFENDHSSDADEIMAEAQDSRRRLNLTAKVAGRVVSFYDLSDHLTESLDETDRLLKESDRELFEDILVKNISRKISARIFHSEKWVENMNRLMEKMDTSMGLSFSLRWVSKKAETEEQLDTKKLVDLLKMDGNLLRDADLEALSGHFRSKIALARRMLEDKGANLTFHAIMREILDYRKWFEFKLHFRKTGQTSRELTNNGFFKFSGGEKAMAMYVPLFSAVNARYEGAGKESARLLSLDEAFAGVDEQNIRDMFRLLNELQLSYVINSQILWGDYDTVDSLAISELIRPDNADYVTVLRYYWNGQVRQLVMDDAG